MSLPNIFFQLLDESGEPIDIEGFSDMSCFKSYDGAMEFLHYIWEEGLYEGNAIIRHHNVVKNMYNGGYKNIGEVAKAKKEYVKGSYGGFCTAVNTNKTFSSSVENNKLWMKKLEMEYKLKGEKIEHEQP